LLQDLIFSKSSGRSSSQHSPYQLISGFNAYGNCKKIQSREVMRLVSWLGGEILTNAFMEGSMVIARVLF
jgi:hypothetical protein